LIIDLSVIFLLEEITNHRDTEDTEEEDYLWVIRSLTSSLIIHINY